MQITAEIQHFFFNSRFYVNRELRFSIFFLSFGRQKQTTLFNISLIIFVFRAVPVRK